MSRKGSIRKRGAKYHITVDVGKDELTGKRKRHYDSFDTEREAELAVAQIVDSVERGRYITETEQSVAEFLTDWLDKSSRHLRPTTEYVYRRYLSLMDTYLPKIKAKDLRRQDAESILTSLSTKYKPSTVRVCKRILSTAFNRGIDWEVLAKNPFKGVRVAAPHTEYVVWTPEEIVKFLDAARYNCEHHGGSWSYYMAYVLAIRTGMRKSEILGLRWTNVDTDNHIIYVRESIHELYGKGEKYVGKTKSKAGNRAVDIDDDLADELRRHRERQIALAAQKGVELPRTPNDYVITTANLTPTHQRNLTKAMVRIIESEQLPRLRFHDLRHTHASLLLKAGISPKVIQERLGHAKIATTMDTYSHLFPSMQSHAANTISELLSSAKRSTNRVDKP